MSTKPVPFPIPKPPARQPQRDWQGLMRGRLTSDVTQSGQRLRWTSDKFKQARALAISLISGGDTPTSDDDVAEVVLQCFAAICLELDMPKNALPGQGHASFEHYVAQARAAKSM